MKFSLMTINMVFPVLMKVMMEDDFLRNFLSKLHH